MTSLFLTNTVSDVTVGSDTKHTAALTAGAASTLRNANGSATPPKQVTDSTVAGTDGTPITWYSPRLAAVTIAGAITCSLWDRENATNNNAAPVVQIDRCDPFGNVISTIVPATINQAAGEMGTTAGGASDVVALTAGQVVDTALQAGDRLKITLFVDSAASQGGTGSLSGTAQTQFWVNGPTGSAGQSEFAFAETLTAFVGDFRNPASIAVVTSMPAPTVPRSATAQPATVAVVAGVGAVTATGGSGGGGGTIVERTATKAETASGQSITGVLPTDRVTGDYVVATFHMATAVGTYTGPGGSWTQILAPTANGLGQIVAVYGQFSPASAPAASTTDVAGRQTCICQAYGVVDTTTPQDFTPAITAVSGTGPSITLAAATIATAGARLISGVTGNFSTGSWTQPAGMTLVMQHTSGTGRAGAYADEVRAATGSTGTRQWTASVTQAVVGYLTALRPAAASGDATATPTVLAVIVAIPAVTATGTSNATVTPAAIAVVTSIPAVTVSAGGNANVSVATVPVVAGIGAVTVTAGATVPPAAVAATTSMPAVTATGTSNATVTPATLAVTAAIPAVTASGAAGGTRNPATIAVITGVGPVKRLFAFAGTSGTITGLQPDSSYQVTVRAYDAAGNRSADSAPVTVTTSAAGSTVAVSPVAVATVVGAPTVSVSAAAQPAALAVTTSVPAVTVTAGISGTRSPATVAVVAGVGAVAAGGGTSATATPATLAVVAAVGAVTVSAGSTISVAAVTVAAGVGVPSVGGGATAAPAALVVATTVGAVTVTVGAKPTPGTVAVVAGVGTVSAGGSAAVSAAAIVVVTAVPGVVAKAGSTVQPVPVAMVTAVGVVTPSVGGVRTPATVAVITAVGVPSAAGGVTRSVATVTVVTAVGAPSLARGALVLAAVIAVVVSVPSATAVTGIIPFRDFDSRARMTGVSEVPPGRITGERSALARITGGQGW